MLMAIIGNENGHTGNTKWPLWQIIMAILMAILAITMSTLAIIMAITMAILANDNGHTWL